LEVDYTYLWLDEPTFVSPIKVITLLGMMPIVMFGIIEGVVALIMVIVSGKDLSWDHVKSG